MVTVFCPRRPGEAIPEFSTVRESEGCFRVRCDAAGDTSLLSLSAATSGPLRTPLPTRLSDTETEA